MIRREIHFPDQEPQWLVISQPEHARLSRVLAENALREFPTQISYTPSRKILTEIIYAIERHDDGWIEWEDFARVGPRAQTSICLLRVTAREGIADLEQVDRSGRTDRSLGGLDGGGPF